MMSDRVDVRPRSAERVESPGLFPSAWRQRMDARLDLLSHCDSIVLEAPVGFGKRSTVERWRLLLLSSGHSVQSIRFDEAANPVALITDLTIRLAADAPRKQDPEPASRSIDSIENSDRKTIYVVEGLHKLERAASLRLMNLLGDLPLNVGAIITTQATLPSEAAPLVAGGKLWRLGRSELALTKSEIREWLTKLVIQPIGAQISSHLFEITSGWPVAIESAAHWLRTHSSPGEPVKRLPHMWPELRSWIDAMVWSDLTAAERRLLADISVLGDHPLDGDLVSLMTEHADAPQMLRSLHEKTPFFTEVGQILQLNPIAASYLAEVIEASDRLHRQKLHRECGRLLAERHDTRAISHFMASGDSMEARQLVDEMLGEVVALGHAPLVVNWLRDTTPAQLHLDPDRLLGLALIGAVDQVAAYLERDTPLTQQLTNENGEKVCILLALVEAWRDDPDKASSILSTRSDHVPVSPQFHAAQRKLQRWINRQAGVSDLLDTSPAHFRGSHSEDRKADGYCSDALCDGEALLDLGQSQAAERLVRSARDLALQQFGRESARTLHLTAVLAAALWQGGQKAESQALLAKWLLADTDALNPSAFWLGHLAAARAASDEDRLPEALSVLDHVIEISEQRNLNRIHALSVAEKGRVAIVAGRPAIALEAARSLRDSQSRSTDLGPIQRAQIQLAASLGLARIHVGQKCWVEARLRLDEADVLARKLGRQYDLSEIRMLRRASETAEEDNPGDPDDNIAEADRRVLRAEVARLMGSFGAHRQRQASPRPKASYNPAASLTARERTVLELMARGTSLKLIAEALGVSRETIKWHQKNIYAKLEIRDRHQVMSVAREIGLF